MIDGGYGGVESVFLVAIHHRDNQMHSSFLGTERIMALKVLNLQENVINITPEIENPKQAS